jgi:hypothetical protein
MAKGEARNAVNYGRGSNMGALDRLQVAAFQALYKMRLAEHGADVAFASALADTSDEYFQAAMKKRPWLVKEWIGRYGNKRRSVLPE